MFWFSLFLLGSSSIPSPYKTTILLIKQQFHTNDSKRVYHRVSHHNNLLSSLKLTFSFRLATFHCCQSTTFIKPVFVIIVFISQQSKQISVSHLCIWEWAEAHAVRAQNRPFSAIPRNSVTSKCPYVSPRNPNKLHCGYSIREKKCRYHPGTHIRSLKFHLHLHLSPQRFLPIPIRPCNKSSPPYSIPAGTGVSRHFTSTYHR